MKKSPYDRERFFEKYSQMDRSRLGLAGAGEWESLEPLLPDFAGKRVLDLGCGYGVIGVTVKKLFPDAEMLMVDVNPRAVELAVLNAQKNSVEAEVRVSDIFENVTETLSDILTNPPIRAGKKVIYAMFEQAYDHLRPQGHLSW